MNYHAPKAIWRGALLRRLGQAAVMLALGCGGCAAPRATLNLLSTAEEAVRANLRADEELRAALAKQSQDQQAALDKAFLTDFRRLAERNGGSVAIADIEQGKNLYDQRLAEILASRQAVSTIFDRKTRTQEAALDLIQKARRLSSGEIEVRNELERTQQEVSGLLQAAFPALNRATAPAGAGGGSQP